MRNPPKNKELNKWHPQNTKKKTYTLYGNYTKQPLLTSPHLLDLHTNNQSSLITLWGMPLKVVMQVAQKEARK